MAGRQERPDDGRDALPDLSVADVLRERPASFRSPTQIARIAIAVTVSWAVGYWVSPSNFGIFAPLTTLLVISTSPWSTIGLSLQRVLSTGLGVLAATLWVSWAGVTWWSVLIAVLVSLIVASRLPLSLGGQFQIPTAVLFVFALGQATWEQAGWRVLDVAIGGAIGVLAMYLPPPRPKPERFEARLQDYRDRIIDLLDDMATELRATQQHLGIDVLHGFVPRSRELRSYGEKAADELVSLAQTAALNPRGRRVRSELDDDALRLRRLRSIAIHVRGIAGAVNKDYDRADNTPALDKSTLVDLLQELATLGRTALGAAGMPVGCTDPAAMVGLGRILDARLRDLADRLARQGTGDVLESVSLLGRLEYVAGQMEGFERIPGEVDDRFEDD
ncbi:MAG: hypothetical protein RL134_77 [Actinomycetota bacterium]